MSESSDPGVLQARLEAELPQRRAETPPSAANTASGAVQAFRDIRRELTEAEMSNPGVQKLILDKLDTTLIECGKLASYEQLFHQADKAVAVQDEKLKVRTAIEIAWGSGLGIGGMCIGAAPGLWNVQPSWVGPFVFGLGVVLIIAGLAIKAVLR